ncbi:hypothetical protein B0H14DRAFT_2554998 [Mycena olivaceomarginata]|nr:hypothetical protein B0H14DRAFT_2554998 [Mycena olivaceomarginata]
MPIWRILALISLQVVLLPLPVRRLLPPTTLLPRVGDVHERLDCTPLNFAHLEETPKPWGEVELNKRNRDISLMRSNCLASVPSMEAVLNALRPWMTRKRTTQIGMHRERVEVDVDMDTEANTIVHVLMPMLVWAWTASTMLLHHPTPCTPPSRHIHPLQGRCDYKYETVDDAQVQAGEEQSGKDGDVDMEGRDGDEEMGFSSFVAYFFVGWIVAAVGTRTRWGRGALTRNFDKAWCRARAGAGVRHAFWFVVGCLFCVRVGQVIGVLGCSVILWFRFDHPAHVHLACSLNTGMDIARTFCAVGGAYALL